VHPPSSTTAPDPEQSPAGSRRRLPSSPVRKPDWNAWTAGRNGVLAVLILPVLFVVGTAAEVLEFLYYLGLLLGRLLAGPYFTVRALWRALRPVRTAEQQRRRAESRRTIRKVSKGFGWALICLAVLCAALVGLVSALSG
jgi:hypothetical protein